MKYQIFLILSLITLFVRPGTIADTYNFDKNWRQPHENQFHISWAYDQTTKNLNFQIDYPQVPAGLNVEQRVFLQSTSGAAGYISHFNPIPSKSAGRQLWKQSIPLATFDDKNTGPNTYPCPRTPKTVGGKPFEIQECFGIVAFVHKSEFATPPSRNDDFQKSLNNALLRFQFNLKVNYDLTVEDTVELIVKTKITKLPCVGCTGTACNDPCKLDVNFNIEHKLCRTDDYACASTHAVSYFYGDIAYIRFDLDVKTRTLTLHSIFATSAIDATGVELPASVLTKTKNDDLGVFYLGIPIAGPADGAGRDFSLKFIFKLSTKVLRRQLEDISDRVLEKKAPVDVTYRDIDGFKTLDKDGKEFNTEIKEPELGKVYTFTLAMIGVISLTCLCLTISNLAPFFVKRKQEAPLEAVKNNA